MFKLWQTGGGVLALALVASAAAQTSGTQMPGVQQQHQPASMQSSTNMQQQSAGMQGARAPAADRSFMRKAAQGGMSEVELGKLAQQKATNDQVKQFGARMEQDHTKANNELKQIAANKGIELPASPSKKQQKDMDKLRNMSGTEFDRAYMKHMVADHKKDIAAFEKEAKDGKDADVKAFAEKTLPTLRQHLEMAQQAQSAVQRSKSSK